MIDAERLIGGGESETVEFKKSTGELREAMETLCGFLNAAGGTVIFGVTATGRIVGQDVTDRTLQEVANAIRKFEPPAVVTIERIAFPDTVRELLALQAEPAVQAIPFIFEGRAYQRISTTTSVMPQERYQRLLINRAHSRFRWENTPAEGVSTDSLDHEEILRTVYDGIATRRLPAGTGANPEDIVERLGLRVEGRLVNAAVVLFGTRFMPFYPQCLLRMARFRGVTKSEFLDNRQIHGHALNLLDEAMLFLERHLPVAGRIEPGRLERVDTPLFPYAALREAVVNALCHRDYAIAGGSVAIAIYDDRLEVWSDGALPFGLRADDLKRNHRSQPRNPLIFDVFYRRGLVEHWGRGTQTIVELCVAAGHPEPEFVEEGGAVGVRFLPSGYVPPLRIGLTLTHRQREILQALARGDFKPLKEIRASIQDPPSDRYLLEDMAQLQRMKLVEAVGRTRGRLYRLRKDTDEQPRQHKGGSE